MHGQEVQERPRPGGPGTARNGPPQRTGQPRTRCAGRHCYSMIFVTLFLCVLFLKKGIFAFFELQKYMTLLPFSHFA
jgi:hypothetical protein